MNLLEPTAKGLYCPAADVYIDPVSKVDRAIITHGHADHARRGHSHVLTSASGTPIVRHRVGSKSTIQSLAFGETVTLGDARISLHPAGHILGSAQVRIEQNGRVAVVTGDYKRGTDPTCEPFESVPCDLLVTETTFGIPSFIWPDPSGVTTRIAAWVATNRAEGFNSVLLTYSLGKAQRVLAMIGPDRGPILVHGSMIPFLSIYRKAGIDLPNTLTLNAANLQEHKGNALILVPPGIMKTKLKRKLEPQRSARVSGWTLQEDQPFGFPISDHVDWPELVQTVEESGASELWATHGYTREVCDYFSERGLKTRAV